MPRIRQYAQDYARQDFLNEIRERQGSLNLMDVKSLSGASGIPYQILLRRLKNPDDLTLGETRKLCESIRLNPIVLMNYLGFPTGALKKLIEKSNMEEEI